MTSSWPPRPKGRPLALDAVAGPVEILDRGDHGVISSDQGEYTMVALSLLVVGAAIAAASLIAARGDPERPRWVRIVAVTLIVLAVTALVLAALAIALLLALCADGCD